MEKVLEKNNNQASCVGLKYGMQSSPCLSRIGLGVDFKTWRWGSPQEFVGEL
jgi:hypothetical protein